MSPATDKVAQTLATLALRLSLVYVARCAPHAALLTGTAGAEVLGV
jgi:hypothetical protein